MKMIWAALITIIFVSAPNLARATTNAGDFGNGAASNASFGTSGSNGGVTIGSGYANTYNAPTNGLIVQGTVGIGTSSPIDTVDIGTSGVWPLYLSSSSTDSTLTESYNSSASVGYYYGTTGTSNPLGSPSGAFVIGKVGTGTYFTITSSGNVGVYTVSPIVALDLSQKTDAIAIPVGTSGSRPTGGNLTNGEIRYNTSTLEVEAYINNAWMPLGGGGIGSVAGIAGHLQCGGSNCSNSTGSTTLNYCPYKGNIKTTASQGNYTIPSGCLSATTTSMYVGGVGSTSLSANTLYYIYLWNNSGTWVLDAETTGHATDSNTGIEVESGDNTKTLIGMIYSNGSKKVMTGGQTSTAGDTNTVATWDNRQPTWTHCQYTTGRSVSSVSHVEVNSENRCYFMSWGDTASFSSSENGFVSTSGAAVESWLLLDGSCSSPLVTVLTAQNVANYNMPIISSGAYNPTEGYHYTYICASVGSGSVTYAGAVPTNVVSFQ